MVKILPFHPTHFYPRPLPPPQEKDLVKEIVKRALKTDQSSNAQLLSFPSKEELLVHLYRHPLLQDPLLREKEILREVAAFFARTKNHFLGVKVGMMLLLNDLNRQLKLKEIPLQRLHAVLIEVLRDYALQSERMAKL